ncbi:hypothetical protein [Henriciella sp.]|uniref:hypothetical protein n=1 Tax=Henriciella sp. TaxID=1968823 RepID=UPI0025C21CE8|nr:hypothetical protein [Henriciella sp.]
MPRLQTLLARAALPFKSKKRPRRLVTQSSAGRDALATDRLRHDDWLFEDERPVVGKPDVLSRLTASLCRLRNCLVDVASEAPIREERPTCYRVEFSDYSSLEDEALFDDELFDRPAAPRPPVPVIERLDRFLFARSPEAMPA